jgi:hypothetical protein
MPKRVQRLVVELEVDSLLDLVEGQDEQMRALFAKAINLYVAPGAEQMSEEEKTALLRQAVEQSIT